VTEVLTRKRFACVLALYFAAALLALVFAPMAGTEPISPSAVWKQIVSGKLETDATIFLSLRLPRVCLGLLAGGTLAMVGASFQVVLRNVLATPYTLGVTGGGTLGAVVAISFIGPAVGWGPFSPVQLLALAGSFVALAFIYLVARRTAGLSMNVVLLAGVTFGILAGALIMLVKYLANPHKLAVMDQWMMGGLDVVGFRSVVGLLPLLVPATVVIVLQAPRLNHLALGEEMAAGHGVDVARVQRASLLAGGVATAVIVSLTGPIGFVGLVVPHIVRRLSGNDQRLVLPASFALGGTLLVGCDLLARALVGSREMPVGIVTAMVGGPVFIYLLVRRTRRSA